MATSLQHTPNLSITLPPMHIKVLLCRTNCKFTHITFLPVSITEALKAGGDMPHYMLLMLDHITQHPASQLMSNSCDLLLLIKGPRGGSRSGL